jgi:hypothetical protein
MIETGLAKGPGIGVAVERVFGDRGGHALPAEIPDPPAFWAEGYRVAATVLNLRARTLEEATATLRAFWMHARSA